MIAFDFVLLPIERSGSGVAPDVVKLTTGREAPPSSPLALQYESGVTITFGSSRPASAQDPSPYSKAWLKVRWPVAPYRATCPKGLFYHLWHRKEATRLDKNNCVLESRAVIVRCRDCRGLTIPVRRGPRGGCPHTLENHSRSIDESHQLAFNIGAARRARRLARGGCSGKFQSVLQSTDSKWSSGIRPKPAESSGS